MFGFNPLFPPMNQTGKTDIDLENVYYINDNKTLINIDIFSRFLLTSLGIDSSRDTLKPRNTIVL